MVALSLKQFQTPIDLIDLKWVGKACFLKYVGGRRPFQWYRLALLIFYAAPLINLNSLGVLDQSCVHQGKATFIVIRKRLSANGAGNNVRNLDHNYLGMMKAINNNR